ncbi:MAG: ABC transporter substrate-binding protein [bacterium]|nr:ABC transporter substrate-binding protein [bacterium]MDE0417034.1 ABC transporter substrate-binding protein [bacterium]
MTTPVTPDRHGAAVASAIRLTACCLACWLTVLALSGPGAAESGVDGTSITFGQSAVFSGQNRILGRDYRAGILAAFRERNLEGGVAGRTLSLIAHDDAYEPDLAARNAERFVADNNVFAVIGGVGTPTARRIAPVLRSADIPFVGQLTGADFLRDAERFPGVINLRSGYMDEIRLLVDYLVRERGKSRFGIIYQDDAFGRSVLQNYLTVLEEYDLPLLAKTGYSRNTHAVHATLFSAAQVEPDTILVVGSYAANAEIINLAETLGHEYIMANLSFVLSHELKKRIDEPSERVLVTEVVPDATDTSMKIVRRYQDAMRTEFADREFNEASLEGYILGRFVIAVLERMEGEWTRDLFMQQALRSGPFHIDDWTVEFQPGGNTGSTYIRLTDLGEMTRGDRAGEEG